MRITLLGHASVLVELDTAVCLMDPVFFDPFEERAVVSCPRRTVHVEPLPRTDLLVVSQAHTSADSWGRSVIRRTALRRHRRSITSSSLYEIDRLSPSARRGGC